MSLSVSEMNGENCPLGRANSKASLMLVAAQGKCNT